MLKNQKGITLIALVVTIVVLLILAAITITLAVNNNGIYNKAVEAQQATSNAQAYDREVITNVSSALDTLVTELEANRAAAEQP